MIRHCIPMLFLLAACNVTPPYPALAIDDDAEEVWQVVVADATLQEIVRVGRPLVERLHPDEFLRVVVAIRNVDEEPIQILAQMAFLDAQRRQLPDETNKQVLLLPPGSTQNFQAISRGPRAADFTLRLEWNK
jgi:hypothetical protein